MDGNEANKKNDALGLWQADRTHLCEATDSEKDAADLRMASAAALGTGQGGERGGDSEVSEALYSHFITRNLWKHIYFPADK